ncbi:(2Fe-2S)-binding protein [Streptomyces sp. ISL-36]|uniref:IucA/IucC family C-terminal-domain containing protein n=1 Tax=Streptomyces sp. ISL-36 TaxID=2819182 RepID=UPI001BE9FB76|nr:IucA/IucC family C-terminal-domain containing protein [Streptomyces sp. ISL-36]MBT2438905.1 (2Fe-2S)-binding protein [Streptomyces sp. ISL-36]
MDLVESASVGGFFALRAGVPGPGAAHRPLARLYAGETGPLTARIDTVAARLGTPERRVAASIAHLGLAARLWSTALGPAALHGRFPELDPGQLHWDGALASPDDLVWAGSATRPATVDQLRETVVDAHLVPLSRAFRQDGRVSPRLLWGNAGSALAGALRELTRWARARDRPEVAARAAELVAGLLAHPDLADTVRGPALRRTTCCLYYRCPSGGLCGDCVFEHAPGSGLETGPTAP